MFIRDWKNEFLDGVIHQHVLMIVNCDVDAVCACKILQEFLRVEHVTFSVMPVSSRMELERAINESQDQIKTMILINCGASLHLVEEFSPSDDVVFFVLDSHRPFHLDNVYDQRQVRLLIREEEDVSACPQYSQIYRDEEEEESEEEASISPTKKRSRTSWEDRAAQVEARREWAHQRKELLWDYYESSYSSFSSALLLFELTHSLSKDTGYSLWWGILGVASQLLEGRLSPQEYSLESVDILRPHVRRLGHQSTGRGSVDNLRITYETELFLVLYKHWSLFESIQHSPITVCCFQLWFQSGQQRLRSFLADLGIPLRESQQKYSGMSTALKKELVSSIKKMVDKYKLPHLIYGSFTAHSGFRHQYNAVDVSAVLAGLLEFRADSDNSSMEEKFFLALEALSRDNWMELGGGVNVYRNFLTRLRRCVEEAVVQHLITPFPSFFQFTFPIGTPDVRLFSRPHGLTTFGRFLLRSFASTNHGKRLNAEKKPLIVEVPMEGTTEGWHLLAGIPPLAAEEEDRPKSFLGQAFEQAAAGGKCRMARDVFDAHIVRLRTEDRGRFFDALLSLLT